MFFLLDVNLLIALGWRQHIHHEPAHRWFRTVLSQTWATTPITETGFVRLSANRDVVHQAVSPADAVAALAQVRRLPGHIFLADDSSLADADISLVRLASRGQITDLHLVNLAAKHGGTLATLDRRIVGHLEPADAHHVQVIDTDPTIG